ncbi:peptide/nickel transport system substrate-binding protein [Actinocorallia herbida]|uniref:Peptide/nickel transport system substrate-binding protein n=1 Tax=Actinocorallia herbida TaxID=58109 RepID=A0A3N1CWD3_9ACTN|nr:ABC transporter substrate-binding protein [Actinocorallia herbida]ROO85593.1 peptide/nickel transport system substrate-binding protein [Actinocorallia herbida]
MRTSRRWRTAAGAAAALALVTGCSGGPKETGTGGGQPRDGGVLTLALEKEPECLDPHQTPTQSGRLLARPILDSLVHQDVQGGLHPWLATAWTVADDGLKYTFTLRDGVTFTDGTTFDAAAVVANLDHVVDPETKSLLAASLISAYAKAEAVDARTVAVTLREPDSGFLAALASPNLGIHSPATLKGAPSDLCAKIVGSGPFRSEGGFVPQQGITYTRNPAYAWAPEDAAYRGPARLDGVEVRIVPDDPARAGALTSGQVDAVTALPPTEVRALKGDAAFQVHSVLYPGANYSYWPNTAEGPLSDVRVRKALRAGVDWDRIVQNVFFGVYSGAEGVLSKTTPGFDPSVGPSYAHDPAAAARLLDEAGWTGRDAQGYRTKDGVRLKLRHLWSEPSVETLAVQVQAAAKDLGIELVEENLDGGTFVERLLAGDYELIDTSFSAPGPDVLRVLFGAANIPTPERGISNNMARYDDADVEADFTLALRATDPAERLEVYQRIQQRITEDAAVLPIYSPQSSLAVRTGVQGVSFSIDGTPDLTAIWLES